MTGQEEANVRGAIFDFAGHLTTMDKGYTVGAKHNAARMAEEVVNFLAKRGIADGDVNVLTWQEPVPVKP